MIRVHSKLTYRGKSMFGGMLREGDVIRHLVSDAETDDKKREELRKFVRTARLPKSLLNNPHLEKNPPHLDAWGFPGEKAERAIDAQDGGVA